MWFILLMFYLRNPCLFPGCKDFSPRLFSGHFIVLTMTFMSLIHFELILGYVVRQRCNVLFFPYECLFFLASLVEKTFLSPNELLNWGKVIRTFTGPYLGLTERVIY